jgi:GNAT superfamily N-acetyltransferase
MKAKRLTAQQAIKLLAEFYETDTPERMGNAFGWDHAPETLKRSEHVFSFEDQVVTPKDGEPGEPISAVVGFGILEMNTRDAADTEAFLSVGVFPAFRRRGYWHKIMAYLIERAEKLGADFASRTVNKDNEEHYARSIREAYSDESGWVYAGTNWFPGSGFGYFVWPFDEKERAEGKKASNGEEAKKSI